MYDFECWDVSASHGNCSQLCSYTVRQQELGSYIRTGTRTRLHLWCFIFITKHLKHQVLQDKEDRGPFVCWVFAYPPLLQHVIHRRWTDVILDHDPSEWDADQMTGFPLGDLSSGAVTTQQFIIGWFQSRRPCWRPVCGRKAQLTNSYTVKTA